MREFATDIREFGDMALNGISNYKMAMEFKTKHIRSGKLSKDWTQDEVFADKPVLATAYDEADDVLFILTAECVRISL